MRVDLGLLTWALEFSAALGVSASVLSSGAVLTFLITVLVTETTLMGKKDVSDLFTS